MNNGAKFVLVISTSWRSYIGFTLSMNWNFDKSCFALIRSELMLSTQYDSQWRALRELSHEQWRTHKKEQPDPNSEHCETLRVLCLYTAVSLAQQAFLDEED